MTDGNLFYPVLTSGNYGKRVLLFIVCLGCHSYFFCLCFFEMFLFNPAKGSKTNPPIPCNLAMSIQMSSAQLDFVLRYFFLQCIILEYFPLDGHTLCIFFFYCVIKTTVKVHDMP